MSRLVNWNIERNPPDSENARLLLRAIAARAPNIVCLTEAHENSAAELRGYSISAKGVRWGNEKAAERKVLLWSAAPWKQEEILSSLEEFGGGIKGVTMVDGADVCVVGLCFPYFASSPLGREPKSEHWQDFIAYVALLPEVFAAIPAGLPTIVVGDFNMRIPHEWGDKRSYELVRKAFCDFVIVTAGLLGEASKAGNRSTIDHVAIRGRFEGSEVSALSQIIEGRRRSDHFGVYVAGTFAESIAHGL